MIASTGANTGQGIASRPRDRLVSSVTTAGAGGTGVAAGSVTTDDFEASSKTAKLGASS